MLSFKDRLKSSLSDALPGKVAQKKLMVQPRIPMKWLPLHRKLKPAGTLILLYPENDLIQFFLTQRSKDVEHHKGQISLPGGVQEKDESLVETALRETMEEIGITENIEILGKLSALPVPVSGFEIHPFVGWLPQKPKTSIQEKEVEKVFTVSIDELTSEQFKKSKKDTIRGFPVNIPYFQLNGETVWGATSMILSEFKEIVTSMHTKEIFS